MEIRRENGSDIRVSAGDGLVTVSANRAGLLSLAQQLIALAAEEPGSSILLDRHNCLEEGSAELNIELTGSRSRLVYRALPEDDPKQRRPVLDLAKKELDWSPRTTLEEGLRRTIDYFRQFA